MWSYIWPCASYYSGSESEYLVAFTAGSSPIISNNDASTDVEESLDIIGVERMHRNRRLSFIGGIQRPC